MSESVLGVLKNLLLSADTLRKEAKLCDVVLYVQSKKGVMVGYPAHKLVLITASRYFKGLFERDDLGTQCLFPSLNEDGLFTLLNIIYGKEIPTDMNIEDALYTAKYLQVESAVEYLEAKLAQQFKRQHVPPPVYTENERFSDHSITSHRRRLSESSYTHHETMPSTAYGMPFVSNTVSLAQTSIQDQEELSRQMFGDVEEGNEHPVVIKVESEEEEDEVDSKTLHPVHAPGMEMEQNQSTCIDNTQTKHLQTFVKMDESEGTDPYQGRLSNDSLPSTSNLEDGGRLRLCRVCGQQFNTARELSVHLATHRQKTAVLSEGNESHHQSKSGRTTRAAQKMKSYRQRKLQKEGDEYRKKERERVRKYYKKAKDMTPSELNESRQKNKLRVARYRQRKKSTDLTCIYPVQLFKTCKNKTT